jgi:lactocepin
MRVLLSNPANATIGDGTGIGTINDDDGPDTNGKPTLDAGSNRAVETSASVLYRATTSDPNGDTVVVTWNFGDGSEPVIGNPVSHAYAGVGLYTVNVTASDGKGGTATDSFTVNAFDTGVIGRAWGDDRILTAVAASQAHWPAGHAQASGHTGAAATDAMIALSDKYPDALAAGPLSTKLDAPLLLSGPSSLPSVVEDELERLGVDTVWLLGGPNSLSPAIEQRLKDLGYEVKRRSGSNRFETAAAVAKEVGRNSAGEVVVTLGDHADQNRAFPDALSAGSLSASPQRMPVVLTLTDSIPAVTEQALADLNTKKVWIVGGLASVSANVEARLRSLGYTVERLAGPGRYETSVDVAEEALSRAPDGPVRLVFATGAKFPDGLAGGAVAGRVDGIMLLVPNGDLPAATRKFLADNADRFDVGVILGGTNTLSESVRLALADLMDK